MDLYLYYMFKFITFLKIEQSIHHEPTIQKTNNKILANKNFQQIKILKNFNTFHYVFIRNTLLLYHYRLKVYH